MATKKPVAKAAPVKSSKVSTKPSTSAKTLSPLEKARLAKASGKPAKGKAKAAPKRAPLPTWLAPEEFKPHFVEVKLRTEKDGLLASAIKATRFVGRYDPEADDKKKIDVASYDQKTVNGILARFAGVTYATNATKRLPPNTTYTVVLRVNRKAADGSLSVLFKGVSYAVKKGTRVTSVDLPKNDVNYRKLRKASRLLPAAFKEVLMPPKRVRGARVESEE